MKGKLIRVSEVAKISGVSVRTIQYYDRIGLLKPAEIAENGYRFYGRKEIGKLWDIMLFKELEFPLGEIKKIVNDEKYDRNSAITKHIELLEKKREHIEGLITFAKLTQKGEKEMNFDVFDRKKMEGYKNLAKEAWGNTKEYKEFEEKDSKYSETEKRQHAENLMDIFFEFGNMKEKNPGDEDVQKKVQELKDFITKHYYTCSDEILASLGEMYVAGGEMTQNIDVAGGKGCAEFVNKAIEIYVNK